MRKPKHRRAVVMTRRFTGWQLCYGLRKDVWDTGHAFQRDLGCLDAPTSIAGGAVKVETTEGHRWVQESFVPRCEA